MRLKCKEKYDNVLDTWHVSFVYSFTNITDHMYKIEEYNTCTSFTEKIHKLCKWLAIFETHFKLLSLL